VHCERNRVIVRALPDPSGGVSVTIGAPHENDEFPRRGTIVRQVNSESHRSPFVTASATTSPCAIDRLGVAF
jgi:hypothetical protein